MVGRFTTLALLISGAYAFLLFHLYQLQVAHSRYYFAQAESQSATIPAAARRGTIYFTDKDGNQLPAAMEKDYPVIYAVPKAVDDPAEAANQAALILGQPAANLLAGLSKKALSYLLLDKNPSQMEADRVDAAKIQGIYTETVPRRFYPFGPLAAQVLGFVGPNAQNNGESGKYGVEAFYDDALSGRNSEGLLGPQDSGSDVVLNIDPAIQTEAEHIVQNLVTKFGAPSGAVIVADPRTGKILAMGATPSFDPNSYASSSVGNFLNPLVEQIYEPGSVVKTMTMVAGIDTGKISPDTTFDDTGTLVLNGHTIKNWDLRGHGVVTMTQVIDSSINTGAAFAERQTGNDVFKSYLQKFGFGTPTGIDLPGEVTGKLSTLYPNAPEINYATASFGQGVSATPIQVLQAIEAIANGGLLMRPYVNSALSPQIIRRVMSADTSKKVIGMMVSAVDTAKVAAIDGYSVAGKTGTAQIPDFVHGGYTQNVVDTYTGFAPAYNPRFIVLIKLNEPPSAPHAADTVVPAFREMAQFLINYFQVPPDRMNH